ncbi:hypothetical protein E2320_020184 [Naja naja]|nr:hypothetical protein E2320_020184 [Naja naja]
MDSAIEAPLLTCPPSPNPAGFLQRNNSLEDKSRLVSAFKERQSSRNLLACENSEKEGRFQKTETDFSNLYARGCCQLPSYPNASPVMQVGATWVICSGIVRGGCPAAQKQEREVIWDKPREVESLMPSVGFKLESTSKLKSYHDGHRCR